MKKRYNDRNRKSRYNSSRYKRYSRYSRSSRSRSRYTQNKFNVLAFIKDLAEKAKTKKGGAKDEGFVTQEDFTKLGLNPKLNSALQNIGFRTMTQVQKQAIPHILKDKSVLAIAATGTGKTGAFLIPLLDNLLYDAKNSKRFLVITPTRELAIQIYKEAKKILGRNHLNMVLTIGGESINNQIHKLKKQAQVVIATPGRLIDLIKRGEVNIQDFDRIVIDEVDKLLDMGFIEDIDYILERAKPDIQLLFFSATYNKKSMALVNKFLKDKQYEIIKLSNNTPVSHIEQKIVLYKNDQDKINQLLEILRSKDVKKAIVFVNTKVYGDKIFRELRKNNIRVSIIHGDKSQHARKKAFNLLKDSKIQVLIATNVLARGIDIQDVTHVINLDAPQNKDEYIHRIGRTGRFGRKGVALTFVKSRN